MQSCGNQIIHMRKIDRQRVNIQGVRQIDDQTAKVNGKVQPYNYYLRVL